MTFRAAGDLLGTTRAKQLHERAVETFVAVARRGIQVTLCTPESSS